MEMIAINNGIEDYAIDIYENINKLRAESIKFDMFVSDLNRQLNSFTSEKRNYKSHFIRKSKLDISIYTPLILTKEQKIALNQYLYDKYIDIIPGDFFLIRPCFNSEGYRIRSLYSGVLLKIIRFLFLRK